MTDYFYLENGAQKGPYKLEQLQRLNLKPDTMIWHAGLTEWIPARNEVSLNSLFVQAQPQQQTIRPSQPGEWTVHYHKPDGRHYWANKLTGETTWDNPYAGIPGHNLPASGIAGDSGILDRPGEASLSEAKTGQTLGIIAICTCFLAIPAFIMGPIAISSYRKVKKIYMTNPTLYHASFRQARVGNILSWIALGVAGYVTLIFLVVALEEI